MVETIIYNYLNNSELSVPVYMEIPAEPSSNFVLIEKTGGSMNNHISNSTIAIQSYADTLYEAAELNEEVKELMVYGLIEESDIVSVKLNSDYNFTDTEEKRYRYQAVFDIVHY